MLLPSSLIEGRRATTHRFKSARTPEVFLRELLETWSANGQVHVRSRHGEWQIASTWRQGRIETVQVKSHPGGLEGLHTIWEPESGTGGLHARSPGGGVSFDATGDLPQAWLPPGIEMLRRVTHQDGQRHLTTVVASSSRPLPELAQALRDRLGEAGFAADPAAKTQVKPLGPTASIPNLPERPGLLMTQTAALMVLRRADEELIATLSRHGERVGIVMHWGTRR